MVILSMQDFASISVICNNLIYPLGYIILTFQYMCSGEGGGESDTNTNLVL